MDVTGDSLKSYKGSLEIDAYGTTKPTPVTTGITVIPQILTIQQLSDNLGDIEYTLVKILNASASGGTTYGGSRTLTDATGNMSLYTSTGTTTATFANDALPVGPHNWTGYAKFFGTTKEFQIRNTNDVQ